MTQCEHFFALLYKHFCTELPLSYEQLESALVESKLISLDANKRIALSPEAVDAYTNYIAHKNNFGSAG